MCKRKSEGGRCNGWYSKQISNLESRYAKAKTFEEKQKIYDRKEKLLEQADEKPVIEVDENMDINTLKRQRKSLQKTAEFYKEHFPAKYEELTSKVGKVARGHLGLDGDNVITDALAKVRETGVSNSIYETYLKNPELSRQVIVNMLNARPYLANYYGEFLEEYDKIDKTVTVEEREKLREYYNNSENKEENISKNIESIKNYLNNEMGIETGDPYNLQPEKSDKRSEELYNQLNSIIPSKMFRELERGTSFSFETRNVKRSSAKTVTKSMKTYELEKFTDPESLASYGITRTMTDEQVKQAISENATRSINGTLYESAYLESVERDEKGHIVGVETGRYFYKSGKRKPSSKDLIKSNEWEEVDNLYSSVKLYRRKREEPTNKRVKSLTVVFSRNADDKTRVHEFVHVLENRCPDLLYTENRLMDSRRNTSDTYGVRRDGGTFYLGTFKDDYMQKAYIDNQGKTTNYEIFSCSVPRLLSGQELEIENSVQNSFLGSLIVG